MILDNQKPSNILNTEIEQVQDQKKEYAILGTFLLKKGLNLYSYHSLNKDIKEVIITKSEMLQLGLTLEGWICFDPESLKATIDSNLIYFQSLNLEFASNYVKKQIRKGKEISNLIPVNESNKELLTNLF